MKRLIALLMSVLFLAVVSGPVFAADTAPMKTPVTKAGKHHKAHHSKKKAAKPSATPTVKK